MSAVIMDGKALAAKVYEGLKIQVETLAGKGVTPGLGVILVGNDPASEVYVRNKVRACERLGIASKVVRLSGDVCESEVIKNIEALNGDEGICSMLVQLPLPRSMDEDRVLSHIAFDKDADGITVQNAGALLNGIKGALPCTPRGIIELLKEYSVPMSGAHAVVVGRSNIVGKPVSMLLQRENCTVTMCHSKTRNLNDVIRSADILVAAIGKPGFITGDMIKPNAAVIDVGINRLESGKLMGDVDFYSASQVAGFITPVPGGVGPMTIAMLMKNTVEAASQ
ncbi:MAG: bifunctional methylenetetrahydrofolate dehydrogenase/methenyltetrahydrofolate cyclohydrolase FolD [Clostridia bacterium]|nr:bifunctional methylenetetrahydrofolate dehydrogenase/methenyltetrahydrofolate cyclohydrolase FolD [Clostridia bacterium]